MPYKSEHIVIRGTPYDRRIKLNDAQRGEIKELRKLGLSYRLIAERYDVSKSLIILVCNPDIAERKRLAFIERAREGRYKPTKEEWAATQREHRAYKAKLYKEGKI
jgi:DNA invertase Pin-like site-specific DNA recombinase